jgi:hypothetical protein
MVRVEVGGIVVLVGWACAAGVAVGDAVAVAVAAAGEVGVAGCVARCASDGPAGGPAPQAQARATTTPRAAIRVNRLLLLHIVLDNLETRVGWARFYHLPAGLSTLAGDGRSLSSAFCLPCSRSSRREQGVALDPARHYPVPIRLRS